MYGTLQGFKDYCTANDYDITAYTDPQITAKLNRATSRIDARYQGKFIGIRGDSQINAWPRTDAVGSNSGIEYPDNVNPTILENATYETAYQELLGVIGASTEQKGAVIAESKSLISGMNKSVTYAEKKYTQSDEDIAYEYVDLLISDLLTAESKSGGMFNICRSYS